MQDGTKRMASQSNPNSFGERLTAAIDNAGVKQTKLAEELEVSPNTICNWKRGACLPRHRHLEPLSIALGMSIAELTGNALEAQEQTTDNAAPSGQSAEVVDRLAQLDLLDALGALRQSRPQLRQLADAIPDLMDLLAEAQRQAHDGRNPGRSL